ncbi:hypothetical protein B0H13DRAFT_2353841 [Mycena leptocephala]|nr:hypothetical protein B0H13DRAFT_2353841 [Mycena leptocephala]
MAKAAQYACFFLHRTPPLSTFHFDSMPAHTNPRPEHATPQCIIPPDLGWSESARPILGDDRLNSHGAFADAFDERELSMLLLISLIA